jgi:hypothetical protein
MLINIISRNKNRADFNYICSLKYRHIPPTPEHLPLDLSWNVDLNYLTEPDSFFESFQASRLPLISDYDLGMKTELSDYPGLFLGDESGSLLLFNLYTKFIFLILIPFFFLF